MTEANKRGPGRPRKDSKPVRLISPPSIGQEREILEYVRQFLVACNQREETNVDATRENLVGLINLLAGVVE